MNAAHDPHPTPAQLQAFDAGRLAPAELEAVERHLEKCPQCSGVLDTLPEGPLVALLRAFAGDTAAVDERGAAEIPAELAGHPRYRVLEPLGAGGMGVVYKAVHRLMERVVALKILDRRLTDRPAFVERFRREVRAAARLAHPNIVTAYDADQAGDTHFLVMEHVAGTNLEREVARRGPLPVCEACALVRQVALGLQHAHERGMVHCDIKPANLLLTPGGQVKILDFGLAHVLDEASPEATPLPSGTVVGTPDYLAPEQARDPAHVDIRADIYSLGCTLYHLLAGAPPFREGTPLQKLLAQQECEPPPLARVRDDVPAALAAVLRRMLAKDPARRYPTPAAVAEALAPLADPAAPQPAPARRSPGHLLLLATGALAAVGTAALAAYLARPERPQAIRPADHKPALPPERPPSPAQGAALMPAEDLAREKKMLCDRALDWLRVHNRWRPDHPIVTDVARKIATEPRVSDAFQVMLGPRTVTSGKWTLLAGHAGALHVFDLTPEQAQGPGLKENVSRVLAFARCADPRRASPRVLLSDLVLDAADGLSLARPITGSIRYHVRARWPGESILRLTFYGSHKRHMLLIRRFRLPAPDRGRVAFIFGPSTKATGMQPGALAVFVDVVTPDGERMIVESNIVAAVVCVAPPQPFQP